MPAFNHTIYFSRFTKRTSKNGFPTTNPTCGLSRGGTIPLFGGQILNRRNKFANTKYISIFAIFSPGHARSPIENGVKFWFFWNTPFPSRKLSGLNSFVYFQTFGSLFMRKNWGNIRVPFGILYPLKFSTSTFAVWSIAENKTGVNLWTSWIVAIK